MKETKLKKVMDERGISPYEISKALGMSNKGTHFKAFYAGKKDLSDATFQTVQIISEFLDLPYEAFMEPTQSNGTAWRITYLKKLIKSFEKKHGDKAVDGITINVDKNKTTPFLTWLDTTDPDWVYYNVVSFGKESTEVYSAKYKETDEPDVDFSYLELSPVLFKGRKKFSIAEYFDIPNPDNLIGIDFLEANKDLIIKRLDKLIKENSQQKKDAFDYFLAIHPYRYGV